MVLESPHIYGIITRNLPVSSVQHTICRGQGDITVLIRDRAGGRQDTGKQQSGRGGPFHFAGSVLLWFDATESETQKSAQSLGENYLILDLHITR